MHRIWLLLVALRLTWVIYPQQGYIHPNEFFQTVEIVAGDVYQGKREITWDMREQIRSIVSPYLISGIPLFAHRAILDVFPSLQSAYIVLVLPRLLMFLASLAVDGAVYSVAKNFNLDRNVALLLCSTSYVTLVYNVRTFTNSLETFFFCALIILITKQMKIQDSKTMHIDLFAESHSDEEPQMETNKGIESKKEKRMTSSKQSRNEQLLQILHRHLKHLDTSSSRRYNVISVKETVFVTGIGVVCVAGYFSHPTFLVYAFMPLLAWNSSFCKLPDAQQTKLGIFLLFALSVTTVFYVCVDTFYFNWEPFKECLDNFNDDYLYCIYLQLYFEVLVSTSPYYFVEENRNPDHLSLLRIRPNYLHLVLHVPLLFGPMTIFLFHSVVHLFKYLYTQGTNQLLSGDETHQKKHSCVMFVTLLFVPLCLLSLFSPQKPRDLIPVLPLFIIVTVHYLSTLSFFLKNVFFTFWISFNLIMSLFYGIFHQGGIVPSLIFIQQNTLNDTSHSGISSNQNSPFNFTEYDKFIYFHTYMPPKHLLFSNPHNDPILDLKGSSVSKLREEVQTLLATKPDFTPPRRIYVLCPGTLMGKLDFKFRYIHSFPYHLTMEDPPVIGELFVEGKLWSSFSNLNHQLSLHLIKVNDDER